MTAAVETAYRALPEGTARCYRLLAAHPGAHFGARVAAAMLATTWSEATTLLDLLVQAHLLEEPQPRRWAYLPNTRDHALAHAVTDQEHHLARERMVHWYQTLTLGAARILTPHMRHLRVVQDRLPATPMPINGRAEALAWLERERVNLVAVAASSAERSPQIAYQLSYLMWPLFHFGRHHTDRETVDQIAVDCARRLGDAGLESEALVRQAWGRIDLGHLGQASTMFANALRLAEQLNDPHLTTSALEGLGHARLAQKNPAAAHELFTRQFALAEDQAQPRRVAMALHNLGIAYTHAGQIQEAIGLLERAVTMFAALGGADPYNRAMAAIAYGRALATAGRPHDAAAQLNTALARMTELASLRGQALAHHALGEIAHATGRADHAVRHLATARALFDKLGDREAATVDALLAKITGGPSSAPS